MRLVKVMLAVAAMSSVSAPVLAGGYGVLGTTDTQVQVPPPAPRGGNGIWMLIGGALVLVAMGASSSGGS